MNDDLISRQAVTDLIMETDPWWGEGMTRTIFDGINRLPAVDAVPVKHGRWIDRNGNIVSPFWERYECSLCGARSDNSNYCPNCGARMDEERKEE